MKFTSLTVLASMCMKDASASNNNSIRDLLLDSNNEDVVAIESLIKSYNNQMVSKIEFSELDKIENEIH